MDTSTEHILQCNQSESLADASGRTVDLMNENATTPVGYTSLQPYWISISLIIFYTRTIILWSQNMLIIHFHY